MMFLSLDISVLCVFWICIFCVFWIDFFCVFWIVILACFGLIFSTCFGLIFSACFGLIFSQSISLPSCQSLSLANKLDPLPLQILDFLSTPFSIFPFLAQSHVTIRVSQKTQKSEFCFATNPTDFHRLDEPPEKISALQTHKRHFASNFQFYMGKSAKNLIWS